MERLTEKSAGYFEYDLVNGNHLAQVFADFDSFLNYNLAVMKLGEYEDAEEDGLLKILPVVIGSDVYFIPSKKNYDLNVLCNLKENNRVYHQKVERITFTERGWYLECDKDCEYGTGRVLVDIFYKETWFTTEAEAEQALAKMKGET